MNRKGSKRRTKAVSAIDDCLSGLEGFDPFPRSELHRNQDPISPEDLQRAYRVARPSEEQDYAEAFGALYGKTANAVKRSNALPPFTQLKQWTERKTDWDQCLRFLRRVESWKTGNQVAAELSRRVFGRPHSSAWNIKREIGEVQRLDQAVERILHAIREAKRVQCGGGTLIAHHPGFDRAMPFLDEAVRILARSPDLEIPPELPLRARGRKSMLRMPLPDDPKLKIRTRREIVAALSNVLQSMKRNSRRGESTRLAKELLLPILDRPIPD